MLQNSTIKDHYIKIQELYNNAVNILTAINQSFYSSSSEINVNFLDTDNIVNTIRIPSFLYLENRIEQLDSNFNSLFEMPKSGEAWFHKASDMYKLELVHSNNAPEKPILADNKLLAYVDDDKTLNALRKVKHNNKIRLHDFIAKNYGIEIDTHSIIDTQIKRLHAYKRQLLNVFRIIHYYFEIKNNPDFTMVPHTFIFGAKAAPSYYFAKEIINLINAVANVVNNDPEVNKYMKIVFMENYGVSLAELIIPASDISEQISTAGKEASGTSNMKFMMNGALTLGTLDGANVEIHERVGDEHSFIFGLKVKDIESIKNTGVYNPWDLYNQNPRIRRILDSLFNGPWCEGINDRFRAIFDEIMNHNDEYYILLDFDAYVKESKKIEEHYKNRDAWTKSCLVNIAKSGYFSSDRTIEQYNKDIWHLNKIEFKK